MRKKLAEILRRLGPYTRVDRHEPHRLADAEIAQQVQSLTRVVDQLAEEVEILSQAVKAIGAEQSDD